MAHVNLASQTRTVIGNQVRKLRREGIIPAVVYSSKVSPINLQVQLRDFYRVYKEAGTTHVIDLQMDKNKVQPCIVHELDINPVSGRLRHIDFLAVDLKEKVVASVPIRLIGESVAVKEAGGVVTTSVDELEVEALPDNIPSEILVDLSLLKTYEDVIRVEDLPKSDNYEIKEEPELVLASIGKESSEQEGGDEVAISEIPVAGATAEAAASS